jgi:Clostripain family
METHTLALYVNGAPQIPGLSNLQNDAAGNIEKLLRLTHINPDPIPTLKKIPVRYSRNSTQFLRNRPIGAGGDLVELWSGIRDFELRANHATELNATTGSLVSPDSSFMLTTKSLEAFIKSALAHETDELSLWFWGHGQGPGIVVANSSLESIGHNFAIVSNRMRGPKPAMLEREELLTPGEIEFSLKQSVPGEKKLAIIAFESCSVCTLELASSLHQSAKCMVASQSEVYSAETWNYSTWPNVFEAHAAQGSTAIAVGLVNECLRGKARKTCMTAIDLSKVTDLMDAIGIAANHVLRDANLAVLLLEARNRCSASLSAAQIHSLGGQQRVDIELLFSEAKALAAASVGEIAARFSAICDTVINAVRRTVLKNGATQDLSQLVNGMSIWFPLTNNEECVSKYARYVYFGDPGTAPKELEDFKKRTNWDTLMKRLISIS